MANTTTLYTGIGKRKTSVAKVFLTEGQGKFTINNKTLDEFFNSVGEERDLLKNPFILANLASKYDVKKGFQNKRTS
jgi:small subunit ribosomal protein S9